MTRRARGANGRKPRRKSWRTDEKFSPADCWIRWIPLEEAGRKQFAGACTTSSEHRRCEQTAFVARPTMAGGVMHNHGARRFFIQQLLRTGLLACLLASKGGRALAFTIAPVGPIHKFRRRGTCVLNRSLS